jgi:predicted nuclease of predicted toxin-antitoxin system
VNRFVVDAQLPPSLVRTLHELRVEGVHVQDVGLRDATDAVIAAYARQTGATVITKDHDYIALARRGDIPSVVLLTCGNVNNFRLRQIVHGTIDRVLSLLDSGEVVIEVNDESSLA